MKFNHPLIVLPLLALAITALAWIYSLFIYPENRPAAAIEPPAWEVQL